MVSDGRNCKHKEQGVAVHANKKKKKKKKKKDLNAMTEELEGQ